MKVILTFIFLFYGVANVSAQFAHIPNVSPTAVPLKSSDVLKEVEGSPYYKTDNFRKGVLTIGDNVLEVFIRYEVDLERMEIKVNQSDNEVYQFPPNSDFTYEVGNETYVWEDFNYEGERITGYFINYFEGNSITLLGKPEASFTPAEKAKTGYGSDKPGRIDIKEKFYVVYQDGVIKEVSTRRRDLRRTFDSEYAQDYLKDNRIRSLDDLITFIEFYDVHTGDSN